MAISVATRLVPKSFAQTFAILSLGSLLCFSCARPPERITSIGAKGGDSRTSKTSTPTAKDSSGTSSQKPVVEGPVTQEPVKETPKNDPADETTKRPTNETTKEPPKETEQPTTGSASALLTEAQFNQMFPNRIPFYTYKGLIEAADATSGFAKEGDMDTRRREIAAVLGNATQESDSFKATREYNMANWPLYCDRNNQQFPCKGANQYFGRGPIQLSWNYNYGAAGDFLKLDLLNNPDLVATDPKIAFQTMMWYWMTQKGPGTMTGHQAIVNGKGFGETIRSINGALECDGKLPDHVTNRVNYFTKILQIMNVSKGQGNDRC